MHRPTPPLPKGGGFASGKTGGIPQACRFPHRFVLLGKCLLWNPSVTAKATGGSPAVPAPFNKGAFGVQRRSPPCQRGVPRQRRGGGIPQSGSFPHRFVLSRSANCESLSQKSKIFASSLWQGSLFALGIVLLCDTGLFQTFNRQRGKEVFLIIRKPKRG